MSTPACVDIGNNNFPLGTVDIHTDIRIEQQKTTTATAENYKKQNGGKDNGEHAEIKRE